MRALLQRVKQASVTVNGSIIGQINRGILVFLGVTHGDSQKDIDFLVEKIINLRIFENQEDKLDFSLLDIRGELLVVSQFTLYGKCDKGRRPDFGAAAPAQEAKLIYEKTVEAFQKTGLKIEQGKFQAMMQVELINDGPLTLLLEHTTAPVEMGLKG